MKDFFSLQNAPLWFLGGLAAIALVLLVTPSLGHALPAPVQPYRTVAFLALGVLFSAAALGRAAGALSAKRRRALDRDRLRLERIYAPLVGLFVDRHVVMSTAILAPRLADRVPTAWSALCQGRWSARLPRAVKILLDTRSHTSSEIEYGRSFPLAEIKAIVQAEIAIVDPTLRNLVRQADYASYEPPSSGGLTDEEQALFLYIQNRTSALEQRVDRAF